MKKKTLIWTSTIATLVITSAWFVQLKVNSPQDVYHANHDPTQGVVQDIKELGAAPAPPSAGAAVEIYDVAMLDNPADSKWWHGSTVYQIWVRSFADSDGDGNGDLRGIISKLDYIKSLGVDAIWLTPIFEAPSYHGYDTVDFYAIESDYGTLEDLTQLFAQANEAGLKVILDLAINHVSDQHEWFAKAQAGDSAYKDYFIWSDEMPTHWGRAWENEINPRFVWHSNTTPYYYGVFGFSQPDLNFKNPEVVEEIQEVGRYWLDKGADGFRLDAIRYVIEEIGQQADSKQNKLFWRELLAHYRTVEPDALFIGEALTETREIGDYWLDGAGFDAAFDFGFGQTLRAILDTSLTDFSAPSLDIDPADDARALKDSVWQYIRRQAGHSTAPSYYFANFINNHDQDRLNAFLRGDVTRARIAAGLLLTLPGTAYVYYGEEIGVGQFAAGDDMYRRGLMQWDDSPAAGFNSSGKKWLDDASWFPWLQEFSPWWDTYWEEGGHSEFTVASQNDDENSLLNFYRTLIAIRKQDAVLNQPNSIKLYDNTGMAWLTEYENEVGRRWVLLNLDPDNETLFSTPQQLSGEHRDIVSNTAVQFGEQVRLRPGELLILQSDTLH